MLLLGSDTRGAHLPPAITAPTQLSGNTLWLRADSLALANNDPVGGWVDGVNGWNFAQTTGAAKPTFKTNVSNSKPALLFDGVDDSLRHDTQAAFDWLSATENTTFLVMNESGAVDPNCPLTMYDPADTNNNHFLMYATAGDGILYEPCGDSNSGVSGGQPAGWNTGLHVLELYRAPGGAAIIVDGAQVAFNGSPADSLSNFTDNIWVGSFNGGFACLGGYIAEISVFNRVLNSTERYQERHRLSSKYGLTVA